jgi:hypothetical protein
VTFDAHALLAGPRGRGLLLHLLGDQNLRALVHRADASARPGNNGIFWLVSQPVPRGLRGAIAGLQMRREHSRRVREMRRPVDPQELSAAIANAALPYMTAAALVEALGRTVDDAKPWQPPDHSETVAVDPRVVAALEPLARLVAEATFVGMWGAAATAQFRVVKFDPSGERGASPEPATPSTPVAMLAEWRAEMLEAEERARVTPGGSGTWWSRPPHVLASTTSSWPEFGPASLYLEEDSYGLEAATITPVGPTPERTFEITGADAWAGLCRDYPLDVTHSCGWSWREAIGFEGDWVVPDWAAVAADWDAVHLTIACYLEAATRPIPVREGVASAIAGFNPDQTVWLTGRPEATGPAVDWRRYDRLGWRALPHKEGTP